MSVMVAPFNSDDMDHQFYAAMHEDLLDIFYQIHQILPSFPLELCAYTPNSIKLISFITGTESSENIQLNKFKFLG